MRFFLQVAHKPAVEARAIENREMRLFVGGAQLDKKIERLVKSKVGTGIGAVDFIDNDNRPESKPKGAHEDIPGLGHRTFVGVNEEQNRVDHREHPLYLA